MNKFHYQFLCSTNVKSGRVYSSRWSLSAINIVPSDQYEKKRGGYEGGITGTLLVSSVKAGWARRRRKGKSFYCHCNAMMALPSCRNGQESGNSPLYEIGTYKLKLH